MNARVQRRHVHSPETGMLNLKQRHAWAGSLALTVASSASAFAVANLPVAPSIDGSTALHIACCSLVFGLPLEGIRRAGLAKLRWIIKDADDRTLMKASINGVEVGEIPEPLSATMRLVAANDPRNYVAQFISVRVNFWKPRPARAGVHRTADRGRPRWRIPVVSSRVRTVGYCVFHIVRCARRSCRRASETTAYRRESRGLPIRRVIRAARRHPTHILAARIVLRVVPRRRATPHSPERWLSRAQHLPVPRPRRLSA